MDIERLIQVVYYILKKYDNTLNYTKLIKLLYLADRKAIDETDSSITEDRYVAMNNGPVLSELYDLIRNRDVKNKKHQDEWNKYFQKDDNNITVKNENISDDKIPLYAFNILDEIDEKYHNYNYGHMINVVHEECPEWEYPKGTSIPIKKEKILKHLGRNETQIKAIIAEDKAFEKEFAYYKGLNCCI